ncbi:MAG: Vat family streptogramin A O-acetyltransferase [Candidatus Magasanikbacteria bacterium]|jgi:virginiamycin A acetyltransferase
MFGPDPLEKYPMRGFSQVGFLKNFITKPNIIVGDYSYYDDLKGPDKFENQNVLYHYPFLGDKLVIGKFCAIATGVKFIMNGANHKISGFSTFPFSIFGNGWEKVLPKTGDLPYKGDTVVGNDVWIGYESLIMPGIKIGEGAIIASRSVVTANVPPYTVVGGNPAKEIRKRFSEDIIVRLLKIAWWDWPKEKITNNLEVIISNNIEELEILS